MNNNKSADHNFELKDENIEEYWEKGYWISPKLINDEDIRLLKTAVDEVHNKQWDYDGMGYLQTPDYKQDKFHIRQFCNAWWVNQKIRDFIHRPLIAKIAAQLMKTNEVRLWHDQAINKPGTNKMQKDFQGGNVGWHQDYGYWQVSNTTNMCTAWIALCDVNEENGAMKTVAGSHKWGLQPNSDTFFDQEMNKLKEKFTESNSNWKEEYCAMKAGQVSFHHSLTFHGSGQNFSNQDRKSIIIHMMPKDCSYKKSHQFHTNLAALGPHVKEGDTYTGDWFPILWKET